VLLVLKLIAACGIGTILLLGVFFLLDALGWW
jgi:hypothetical protein